MSERGAIRNPARRLQLADFTGLLWGRKTPTDIDGFLDFDGRLFVFIEGKHGDRGIDRGQEWALERLCDKATVPAAAFVVTHNTPIGRPIDYANASVMNYRWQGRWLRPLTALRLRDGIERIRRIVFPNPLDEHVEWIAAYEEEERKSWAPRTAKEMWGS